MIPKFLKHTRVSKPLLFDGLIGALFIIIGTIIWYMVALTSVSSSTTARTFEIQTGESASVVAANLKAAGLIRNQSAFVTYLNIKGLRSRIKAGTYSISENSSAQNIAQLLVGGKTLINRIIIPEGYTVAQIRTLAEKQGISGTAFDSALAGPHSEAFIASIPPQVGLEGYLFPDSYELTSATSANALVDAMLNNFEARIGDEYVRAFNAQGLTLHQGLTLASIVEREVNIEADRPIVAQIFLKRFREGMPLGSDVTTEYASQLAGMKFNLNLDSPYNTRKVTGLPPGPICNPGLSALDAVANPASTDYTYFLSGKDGKTYYAKTYAEHQNNIIRYLN